MRLDELKASPLAASLSPSLLAQTGLLKPAPPEPLSARSLPSPRSLQKPHGVKTSRKRPGRLALDGLNLTIGTGGIKQWFDAEQKMLEAEGGTYFGRSPGLEQREAQIRRLLGDLGQQLAKEMTRPKALPALRGTSQSDWPSDAEQQPSRSSARFKPRSEVLYEAGVVKDVNRRLSAEKRGLFEENQKLRSAEKQRVELAKQTEQLKEELQKRRLENRTLLKQNVVAERDLALEHEAVAKQNEAVAKQNEAVARKAEEISLQQKKEAEEKERAAKEKERKAKEEERKAREEQRKAKEEERKAREEERKAQKERKAAEEKAAAEKRAAEKAERQRVQAEEKAAAEQKAKELEEKRRLAAEKKEKEAKDEAAEAKRQKLAAEQKEKRLREETEQKMQQTEEKHKAEAKVHEDTLPQEASLVNSGPLTAFTWQGSTQCPRQEDLARRCVPASCFKHQELKSFAPISKIEAVIEAADRCAELERMVRVEKLDSKENGDAQEALRKHVKDTLSPRINKAIDEMLDEEGILTKLASRSQSAFGTDGLAALLRFRAPTFGWLRGAPPGPTYASPLDCSSAGATRSSRRASASTRCTRLCTRRSMLRRPSARV